jgi:hypothetical protein
MRDFKPFHERFPQLLLQVAVFANASVVILADRQHIGMT